MGSKTPNDHRQGPNGPSADAASAVVNPPKTAAATGLLLGALEGQDLDGDDDEEDCHNITGANLNSGGLPNSIEQRTAGKKKKRKRSKNKKNQPSNKKQTVPPRVAVADLFANQPYLEGEIVNYDDHLRRTTREELRQFANNMDDEFMNDYRKAAEVHRQVRQYAQTIAKPGISMSQLAQEIEDGVRALTGHQGIGTGDALKAGMGFPTGLCLNNVGAHWTPNRGAKEVILQQDDVLKVDFGVHVNGRIVDSAFTMAFNPVYDNLLAAVKAATDTGLKEAGIDARIDHISEVVQEVMESYEVELNGKTIPVKAVRNITGHNILHYQIHGDKQVPFVKSKTDQRMEEGDVFAIETFGSTGKGYLRDDIGIYGYSRNKGVSTAGFHHPSAKSLLKLIDENFGTLPFARNYLERVGAKNYHLGMKTLVSNGIVECYAPLVDIPGSYIAQFEHTVLLRPNCKEVISRGDDY